MWENPQQGENELYLEGFLWKSTHCVLGLFQTGQNSEMHYMPILVYRFFSSLKQVPVLQ